MDGSSVHGYKWINAAEKLCEVPMGDRYSETQLLKRLQSNKVWTTNATVSLRKDIADKKLESGIL
jgi:hypothetical protein